MRISVDTNTLLRIIARLRDLGVTLGPVPSPPTEHRKKMEPVNIILKKRALSGKDVANKVRRAGLLPAVVYGKNMESVAVALDPKPLHAALNSPWGRNTLLHLTFEKEPAATPRLAIVREAQLHPIRRTLTHADLWEITPETKLEVVVPVRTVGKSEGEKVGAKLQLKKKEIKVSCLPANIPSEIVVDVTAMQNGEGLSVERVPLPSGVAAVYRRPFTVVFVGDEKLAPPTAAEAAAAAAAAAPAAAAPAPAKGAPAAKAAAAPAAKPVGPKKK